MIKKLIFITLSLFSVHLVFGQSESNLDQKTGEVKNRKFEVGLGASCGKAYNRLALGGNLNFEYYFTPKLGILSDLLLTSYKQPDYSDYVWEYGGQVYREYNNGLSCEFTLGVNYYLLGNHNYSRIGAYTGIGAGVLHYKEGYSDLFSPYNHIYKGEYVHNVFVGNLTFGLALKAGPGKIFLENHLGFEVLSGRSIYGWKWKNYLDKYNYCCRLNFGYAICF
jgi:hypothetical protein